MTFPCWSEKSLNKLLESCGCFSFTKSTLARSGSIFANGSTTDKSQNDYWYWSEPRAANDQSLEKTGKIWNIHVMICCQKRILTILTWEGVYKSWTGWPHFLTWCSHWSWSRCGRHDIDGADDFRIDICSNLDYNSVYVKVLIMRLADLDMDGPGDSHSDKLRSDLHKFFSFGFCLPPHNNF